MNPESQHNDDAATSENAVAANTQPDTPTDAPADEQLDPGAVATTSEQPGSTGGGTDAEQQATHADPDQIPAAVPPQQNTGHSSGGAVAGAGAVVSAVLGAMSLLGNPLSEMLRRHKTLSAQLDQTPGGSSDQIDVMYTMPWHTVALSNGIIAVLGVLLGGVVLATWLQARHTQWAKAVALGGMILGVLGVLMSAGMYFDLFATPPEMPEQQMPGMP